MPTHTPSPRRFLVSSQPSAQKAKPKPPSSLRNAYTVQTPKAAVPAPQDIESSSRKVTPARRFVIAPHRRTKSAEHEKGKERDVAAEANHETQVAPRPKPRRKFERVESIEEPPKSSPDGPPHDDRGLSVLHSVEHDSDEELQAEQEDEDEEILFVTEERNKRRRVSPPTSPSLQPSSDPTTPTAVRTHRFVVPPPRTPAAFTTANHSTESIGFTPVVTKTTPAPHRPAFILPPQSTSPPKPSKPLPEIFSPSRKSQKYVPSGLAATMQGWIIETANTGFAAQERSATGGVVYGRDREDGVRLRVRVTAVSSSSAQSGDEVECYPGHFVFVVGDTEPGLYNHSRAPSVVDNDGKIMLVLAGQGGARGAAGLRIKVGGVLGVRAPMWNVDVGRQAWMVGVDWVAL